MRRCDESPLTRCERVFDRERKDMFRYVLFVHALGLPKKDCLVHDPANSNFGFPDTACQMTHPDFHVPVTNTGVADFPGGDAMVALGGFNDASGRPVGTDYMQAATLAHELGHTFQLRHGGAATEPNCKPNYLSVMNYLFQLRGLRKDAGGRLSTSRGSNCARSTRRRRVSPADSASMRRQDCPSTAPAGTPCRAQASSVRRPRNIAMERRS